MTSLSPALCLITAVAVASVVACGSAAHSQPTPIAPPSSGTPIAPPSSASAPSGRSAAVLAAHNAHRARHCAPPLRWSPAIASAAQRYADELVADGCAFRHSRGAYGENLMRFAPAGSRDASDVVDAWYGEESDYNYNRPGFSMTTGHFTQVVWAGSTELGCGVAVCDGGETWVCNYSAPGNMQGAFPANVQPATCR